MENIKPEGVLEKHLKNTHNMPGGNDCILIAMREYAQITCSTLSEEIRLKDERIEELESALKDVVKYANMGGLTISMTHVFFNRLRNLLTPPTNP